MQHAQDGIRVLPGALSVHQQQGLQTFQAQACIGQQLAADLALYGGELKNALLVVLEQELHPAIAQQTLRIKDHNHAFSSGSNR